MSEQSVFSYEIGLLPAVHGLVYQIFKTKSNYLKIQRTAYIAAFTLRNIRNPIARMTE